MTMGEKILALRKARGWSQEELAERIGVTRQAVSRWESGAAKPDADKIIAVCDLFGVSADYLLRDYAAAPMEETAQQAAPRQTTAIGDAMRAMTLRQWMFFGLTALGVMILLALRFVYIMRDCNYSYQAFIEKEELLLFYCGAWVCVLSWPVSKWFGLLKKQMGDLFGWDG